MESLETQEIIIRMLVAILAGGIIGYERDYTGHDAGARTHILVSLGATIATMVQIEIIEWGVEIIQENPDMLNAFSINLTRITAQVISGIGFLGAGTIIVTKRSVSGLTTAASIWTIAAIGIAVGMGFYFIALLASALALIVLSIFKHLLRPKNRYKQVKIVYTNRKETVKIISQFFEERNIGIDDIEYSVNLQDKQKDVSEDIYTLILPSDLELSDMISELMAFPDLIEISTIKGEL